MRKSKRGSAARRDPRARARARRAPPGAPRLLGAALQVHGGLLDHGEDAGRLADNVRARRAPRHLRGRGGQRRARVGSRCVSGGALSACARTARRSGQCARCCSTPAAAPTSRKQKKLNKQYQTHLVGVAAGVELDGLAVDGQRGGGLVVVDGARELAVRRVVLEEVRRLEEERRRVWRAEAERGRCVVRAGFFGGRRGREVRVSGGRSGARREGRGDG